MTITELIGRLLAELVAHGDMEVRIWNESEGQSSELRIIDSWPGDEDSPGKVVFDVKRPWQH
jgi:hypothetical protein